MSDIYALEEAQKLWQNPAELIELWDTLGSKERHENLVAMKVHKSAGGAISIVDLGCGAGRYAKVLKYDKYTGFDSSPAMVATAKEHNEENSQAEFSCVDILNFQIHTKFDAAICIDVVHHQNNPIDAIIRLMKLWDAERYFFTVLVGDIREDLYNSTIVPFSEFLRIDDEFTIINSYVERFDNNKFAWVLVELCHS